MKKYQKFLADYIKESNKPIGEIEQIKKIDPTISITDYIKSFT